MKKIYIKRYIFAVLFLAIAFMLFKAYSEDTIVNANLLEKQIQKGKSENNKDQIAIKIIAEILYREIENVEFNLDIDKEKAVSQGAYYADENTTSYTSFLFIYEYDESKFDLYSALENNPSLFNAFCITKDGVKQLIKLSD